MHVAFLGVILTPTWRGGEPRSAKELTMGLQKKGVRVSHVGLKRFRRLGLKRRIPFPTRIIFPTGFIFDVDVFIAATYLSKLQRLRPDIVMTWFDYDTSAIYASKLLGIPVVTRVGTYWPICPKLTLWNKETKDVCKGPSIQCKRCALTRIMIPHRMKSRLNRLNDTSAIVVASNFVKRKLTNFGYSSEKISVIPVGVDTTKYYAKKSHEGRKVVLSASNPNLAEKGVTHFIELARSIKHDFPHVRFIVTGGGRRFHPAVQTVSWITSEADMIGLYQDSYCVVIPSLWDEPFGRVALEAMACGKPVVAYAVGGIPEIVVDGETGFLVPRGDIRTLIEKTRLLIEDEELALELGCKARVRAERKFNIDEMTKKYLKVFRSAINQTDSHR